MSKSHSNYESFDASAYFPRANEDTIVVAQIETKGAVENMEEILSVEGVDASLVGINDLSISLGINPPDASHPTVVQAIETQIKLCKKYGKSAGLHLVDMERLAGWIKNGINLAALHTDVSLIKTTAQAALSALKSR